MNESPGLALPSVGFAWVDVAGLALVCIMCLLGAISGLWWQLIRFLGLLGAVVLASTLSRRFSPTVAQTLSEIPPGFVRGATWATIFLAGLAAAAAVGLLGRRLLVAMKLGLVDRAGGALVGVATAVLIHVPIVAILVQVAPPEWAERHVVGSISARAVEALGSRWDELSGSDTEREPPHESPSAH